MAADVLGACFLRAKIGAGTMNRTRDLLITNQLLYQLSYAGFVDADYSRKTPQLGTYSAA